MSFYKTNIEKKRIPHDFRRHDEEVVKSLCRLGSRPISPRSAQEQEKRIRREIANSNERRRMQSINAGFQFLRNLLPKQEGEKLSKASILQQTADYIFQLEQQKAVLLENNCKLKRINAQNNQDSDGSCSESPFSKRRKREDIGDLVDEGIGGLSPTRSDSTEDIKRELIELKLILEHERNLRTRLEEQIKKLESRLVPENVYEVALQDHVSYHSPPQNITKQDIVHFLVDDSRQLSPHVSDNEDQFQEVPISPKLPFDEVPEDLSGKNSSPVDSGKEEMPQTSSPTTVYLSPVSVKLETTSQPESFKSSKSRPNLETIVEAIRHVEGDHMFRDDPSPSESPVHYWSDQEKAVNELYNKQTFSLQHQIIRNAPISQSRPGVIVSKLT